MALATLGFAVACGLAWWPFIHGGPGSVLPPLLIPIALGVGLHWRKPALLSAGLAMLVFLGIGDAVRGNLLPAAGAVALGLASWDMGLLSLRLGPAKENARTILKAQAVKALGVAGLGFAACAGFSTLRLTLPFWGLMGMLAAVWAATVFLLRASARVYSADGGEASGKRSSSSPRK